MRGGIPSVIRKTLTIASLVGLVLGLALWGLSLYGFEYGWQDVRVGDWTAGEIVLSGGVLSGSVQHIDMALSQQRPIWGTTHRSGLTLGNDIGSIACCPGDPPTYWAQIRATTFHMDPTGCRFACHASIPVSVFAAWPVYLLLLRMTASRHRKLGLCVECGYALQGLTEPRCPECGKDFQA